MNYMVLREEVSAGNQVEYEVFETREQARKHIETDGSARENFCWVVRILDEYVPPIDEKPASWHRHG